MAGLETPLENPDELLIDKGSDLSLYDKIMRDDVVNSTISLKIKMALSVDGEVMPISEDDKDIERAQWLNKMLYQMTPDIWDFFNNMLHNGMIYGFGCGEIMWDTLDAMWIIKQIKIRHSILFDFKYDTWGDLEKLYIGYRLGEDKWIQGKENISNKFALMVWPYLKDGNYYGESDLKSIYLQYYSKYYTYRWRNTYLQNFGQPLINAVYEAKSVTESEKADMSDFLKNLQDNQFLLTPGVRSVKDDTLKGKFELNLLEAKSTSTEAYEKAVNQINTDIRRALLLPDEMGYSTTDTGSNAKAKTQFDNLVMVLKDIHGRLEDVINPILRKIEYWNFGTQEDWSEWKFRPIDKVITTDLLNSLITVGVIDKREKWIRAYTGVPEITVKEQEEIEKANEEEAPDIEPGNEPNDDKTKKDDKEDSGDGPLNDDKGKAKDVEFDVTEFKTPSNDRVDFEAIRKFYDDSEKEFIKNYNEIVAGIDNKVVEQVQKKKILETGDLGLVNSIRIKKQPLQKLFKEYYWKMYAQGIKDAYEESEPYIKDAKEAFVKGEYKELQLINREWIDDYLGDIDYDLGKTDLEYLKRYRDQAFFITGQTEEKIINKAFYSIKEGIDSGTPMKETIASIRDALAEERKRYAITIARTNASDAYNNGRMNFFKSDTMAPLIAGYEYHAILDEKTTFFCQQHDGQRMKADSAEVGLINPPNHFNCRSLLQSIFITDKEDPDSPYFEWEADWGKGVPFKAQKPAVGFGG